MALPPTPPPPMSTSSLPPSVRRAPVRLPPVKPPILASDILREEVAPQAPARRALRGALIAMLAISVVGVVVASWGIGGTRLGARWALEGAACTAILAAVAAFVPLPYALRAAAGALAGAIPLLLGAAGLGPLSRLGDEGGGAALAMAAMATALPGALLFRSRYRAFRAARVILAIALAVSVPAVVLLAMTAADGGVALGARALAAVGVAAALAATLGFMGPETSGGCAQWAALVVGAYAARPTWRAVASAWSGRDPDTLALSAAALGALVATTLVTFALFQLLAAVLGGQARQVDVHRAVGPGASDPGPKHDSAFED
ncbi:MAG: hypothetical protein ACLQBL_31575 [Polyangiaceae bacterium]|jgi:hypothetical protein